MLVAVIKLNDINVLIKSTKGREGERETIKKFNKQKTFTSMVDINPSASL